MKSGNNVRKKTMQNFDFKSFTDPMNPWYEIGSNTKATTAGPSWKNFGKSCENKLISFSVSEYETAYMSSCYHNGQKIGTLQGRIYQEDPYVPSRLEIDFGSDGKTPYWVYDTDYSTYAIVGDESGKYRILSRTSAICKTIYNSLLPKLLEYNFDISTIRLNRNTLKDCNLQK